MTRERFEFGGFTLDLELGSLRRDGQPVAVSSRGLLLLEALVRCAGSEVSKAQLMEAAWPGLAVEESNLSVQIAALRKLLGTMDDGSSWIATVPRVGYRFMALASSGSDGTIGEQHEPSSSRPAIAVLPFAIGPDSRDKEYLADGITDDIIMALMRFRWFRVVSRSSSFVQKGKTGDSRQIARELCARYLLEGSVRQSSRRLRLSTHLVDAETGTQLWAERYDLPLADAFAIQDEIAERVAGAIEPELLRTEGRLATTRHTGNVTAWDLVRQGTWQFHKIAREGHHAARKLFRHACSIDPGLPEAQIWLARVNAGLVAYGWSDDPGADIREGMEAAARAIHLDGRDPYAHYAFAITSAYGRAPRQAVLAAEKAVALNSSFALGHLVLGMCRLFDGHAAEAVAPLELGLSLNPNDPQNFIWLNLLARAQLLAGHADKAIICSKEALKVRPDWRPSYETLAACHAAAEDFVEAQRAIRRADELRRPEGDGLARMTALNPHWSAKLSRLLEVARKQRP
jgi:TolB-like protein/tetratricopeptide (TPR) repeat protein